MQNRRVLLAAAAGTLLMAAASGTALADHRADAGYRAHARAGHAAGVLHHVPVRRARHHVVRRHASAGHYRIVRRAQHYRHGYRAPHRYGPYRYVRHGHGHYYRHHRYHRHVDVGAVLAGAILGKLVYEALDDDREPVRYEYRR